MIKKTKKTKKRCDCVKSIKSFLSQRRKVVGALIILIIALVIGSLFVFAGNPPVVLTVDGKAIINGQVDGSVSPTPVFAGTANPNSLVYLYSQPAPIVKEITPIGGATIVAPEYTPGSSGGTVSNFVENFEESFYQNGWGYTNAGGYIENGYFQVSSFNSGASKNFDMNLNTQPGFAVEGDFWIPEQYGKMTFDFGIQNNFGPPHKSLKFVWADDQYQKGVMIAQNSDLSSGVVSNGVDSFVLASDSQYPKMNVGQTYRVRLEYDGNTTARAYIDGNLVLTANNVAPLNDYYSDIEGGNIRKEVVIGIRAGYDNITPRLNIDNIVTDFKVESNYSTPDSYLLAKQGFSMDGVSYNGPAPMFGEGVEGILSFASNNPSPLPATITSDDFKYINPNLPEQVSPISDIYIYLASIHIDPGVMGNASAIDSKWTMYDIKNPYQFVSMIMSTLPPGATITVDGYTKVFIADRNTKTFSVASAPLNSLGNISVDGNIFGNEGIPVLIARTMSDSSGNWTANFGKDENGSEILAGKITDLGSAPYNIFAEVDNGNITKVSDSPDLSLAYNAPESTSFTDGFDDNSFDDLWSYSNNYPNQSNGQLALSGSNVAVESRYNFSGSQSFFVEADLTNASGVISFYDLGIHSGFGPGPSLKFEWGFDSPAGTGTISIVRDLDNSIGGDSSGYAVASKEYQAMQQGQAYKVRLSYNAASGTAEVFINGNLELSAQVGSIDYQFKTIMGIRASSGYDSLLIIDNFVSNLPVQLEGSYLLSATAMSYDGASYDSPAPMFGDPNAKGILLWNPSGGGPMLLPQSMPDSALLGGLYVYLTHLDIPAGVVGPDPAVFDWTIYSGNPTAFYSGVMAMFASMGIDASVVAFARVDQNIDGNISAITLPVISQGSITSDGQILAREKSATIVISEVSEGVVSGDSDGDGINDNEDNCPYIQNAEQEDANQDGIGDLCDVGELDKYIGSNPTLVQLAGSSNNDDLDGDRILNWEDICPLDPENMCIMSEGQRYIDANSGKTVVTGSNANSLTFDSGAFSQDTIAWLGVSSPYTQIPGVTPSRVAISELSIDTRALNPATPVQVSMNYDLRFPASAFTVYKYDETSNTYTPVSASCYNGKCTFAVTDITKKYVLGQSCVIPKTDLSGATQLDQDYKIVDTFDQPTLFCPGEYRLPAGTSWLTNTSIVDGAHSKVFSGSGAPVFVVGNQTIPNSATNTYGITKVYINNANSGIVSYQSGPAKNVDISGVIFNDSQNAVTLNSDVIGGRVHSCRLTNVKDGIIANNLNLGSGKFTVQYNVLVSGDNLVVAKTNSNNLDLLSNVVWDAKGSLADFAQALSGTSLIDNNIVWSADKGIVGNRSENTLKKNAWMYSINGFAPGNYSKDFGSSGEGNFWRNYQPPFFRSELVDSAETGTKSDSKAQMFQRQSSSDMSGAVNLKAGYAGNQAVYSNSQAFTAIFGASSLPGTAPQDNQTVYVYGTPSYFINAIPHSPLYTVKTFKALNLQNMSAVSIRIPKVSSETAQNTFVYKYDENTGSLTKVAGYNKCTTDVCTAYVGTDMSGYFVVAEMFPESQADKTPPTTSVNVSDTPTKVTVTITSSDDSGVAGVFYCIGAGCIPDKAGSTIEITEPGDHIIRYVATDELGNSTPIQEVTATHVVDSDGDGIPDGNDACPNTTGTANFDGCPFAIDIDSQILVNYIGKTKFTKKLPVKVGSFNDPMNEEITGVEAKVYKKLDLGSAYGNIQQNCGTYYDSTTATPVNVKSMPLGTELIGVPEKVDYVVMQRVAVYEPTSNTTGIVTTCRNVDLKDFTSNTIKKEMPIIKSVKDGKATLSGGQTTVMTGSMLEIVYPENVLWEEGIKDYVYTYIFTSDSDWSVDVCTYAPEGYKVAGVYDDNGELVANGNCTQAFVANETKVIAFEVVDIGSPKIFDVELKITGKRGGKQQKLDTKINTKIVSKDKIEKSGKVTVGEKQKVEKKEGKKVITEGSVETPKKVKKSVLTRIADFFRGLFN